MSPPPPPRKPGRPSLVAGEKSTPFTINLPNSHFDQLCARANRDRVTPRDVVRRAISRLLADEDDDAG
jgi:hypothetical protein